ncbi:Alpha/Beta hydrolase protein [Auriculariales sp. MPI-PUGE-AT-0066]|nr:Alpha/Beta hydrolase protein [Auriculariales sp. MPI-PUGE-AT-0066]
MLADSFVAAVALLSLVGAVPAVPVEHYSSSKCTEFYAPVTATATNVANITLDSPGSGSLQVGPAAFNIFFHFCTPSEPTERSKTVQILAHGATYTHEYWNLQYKPEMYSYERAALAQGYSILSYDALGIGRSAHPDPLNVVQLPLLTQLVVGIVQAVRSGTLAPPHIALPDFDKIVYMGHSLGSMTLNTALAESPDLPVDAAVFTGFTHSGEGEAVSNLTLAHGDLQIASQAFPDRFGSLSDGYTVIQDRTLFYAPPGSYEDGAFEYDVETQDTVSVGLAFTLRSGFVPTPAYSGHVLVVIGDQDVTSCNQPGCANVFQEAAFYSAAASFEAQVIPNTGHVLNLHKSSVATYTVILDWLTRIGF